MCFLLGLLRCMFGVSWFFLLDLDFLLCVLDFFVFCDSQVFYGVSMVFSRMVLRICSVFLKKLLRTLAECSVLFQFLSRYTEGNPKGFTHCHGHVCSSVYISLQQIAAGCQVQKDLKPKKQHQKTTRQNTRIHSTPKI